MQNSKTAGNSLNKTENPLYANIDDIYPAKLQLI
jgi:hypothetical protein